MGNNQQFYSDANPWQYCSFKDEEAKEGESKILRRKDLVNKELLKSNEKNLLTIIDAFEDKLKKYPEKPFLGTRIHIKDNIYGEYKWKNYKEINVIAHNFINAIDYLKLCEEIEYENKKYKFLGIYSRNREEWVSSYIGCQLNSIIVVTLYDTLGMNAIEFILNQTELNTILIESLNLKKLLNLKQEKKIEKVNTLIILPCADDKENLNDTIKLLNENGIKCYLYEEFLKIGKEHPDNHNFIKSTPETYTTFCYTSGTTGNPKGAMIKNKSLLCGINAMTTIGRPLYEHDIYLSFLPLAHIMEQLIFSVNIYYGTQYAFYSGNASRIVSDCQALKPTYLCTVPRVLQKIYNSINMKINNMTNPILKAIALKAIETKLHNYETTGSLTHTLYDNLVFNKIKDILGGNVNWMLVGSAPMPKDILKFLRICFGIPITEGYGQTEDCAGVLLCNVNDCSVGHLGGLNGGIELKLVDVPELGYTSKDKNPITKIIEPRGEICIRGSLVFDGYYKDKEKTDETIDKDGWLHSGDIGIIMTLHGNCVKIIDRVKNIFKLSQGEYIAPDKIANFISLSKYINQIFIYGETLKSYLVAIVVPEKKECVNFLQKNNKDATNENIESFYNDQYLKTEILNDMDKIGRKYDLKGFEIPKKIYLSKEDFTIENNMMTPTMKLKYNEIKKKYINELEELYKE